MKLYVRIILSLLCAAMILAMPFVLSSPRLLDEAYTQIMDALEEDDWLSRLFPSAYAEEEAEYALPIDFTPGPVPNPEGYTENGYQDASILVQLETIEEDGVIWRLAWVDIASPTQLRTATSDGKMTPRQYARVRVMADDSHAVVAMNGDFYMDNPQKTSFEYRMGKKVRAGTNQRKDTLIIDENGDFHIVQAQEKKAQQKAFEAIRAEHQIINAFTFGPALVINGERQLLNKEYDYNRLGREPRSAIGQMGKLSYVMVVAEGRGDSAGVTQQELADFMESLGCQTAYNLDGGGTACIVFQGEYYNRLGGSERNISDIIYFATAVKPE